MKKSLCMIALLSPLCLFVNFVLAAEKQPVSLYWFIPDGMRADPDEFQVYEWARQGKLPNIKKMITEGAHGYSIPDFPSHTPTNFASLLTGAHPHRHGIADGPMHVEGAPLAKPSAPGFSSQTKRVPPFWVTAEREFGRKVVLLSIPGSTPPELDKGVTIRGRWGGWGADLSSVVFESSRLLERRKEVGRGFRLFYLGTPLTSFVDALPAKGWDAKLLPEAALESTLQSQGLDLHALVRKRKGKFRDIALSFDKKKSVATLQPGEWSPWIPVVLPFKESKLDSNIRVKLVKLWPNGDFRIRVQFDALNRLITKPDYVAGDLQKAVGPMVDHADNWPHQLIYEPEDKELFLEEARQSLAWHRRAVGAVYDLYSPDIFIQDIYTPNMMLESRWWYGALDKQAPGYSKNKAARAMKDVLELYKGLDAIVGEAMKRSPKSLVVLSSDHGVCHLRTLVRLNNFFAKKGWLKFRIDEKTGEAAIDWENTKVIYLKMAHVYISPSGLAGDWHRAKGAEYQKLRGEVAEALRELRDPGGKAPIVRVTNWEDAEKTYNLPADRIGDLVIEASSGFFWHEEPSNNLELFSAPVTTGYKQAIDPKANKCMWTPFVVWGPGVKKGYKLAEPISHVDQLPTILELMDHPIPSHVEGKPLTQMLKAP